MINSYNIVFLSYLCYLTYNPKTMATSFVDQLEGPSDRFAQAQSCNCNKLEIWWGWKVKMASLTKLKGGFDYVLWLINSPPCGLSSSRRQD